MRIWWKSEGVGFGRLGSEGCRVNDGVCVARCGRLGEEVKGGKMVRVDWVVYIKRGSYILWCGLVLVIGPRKGDGLLER